MPLMCNEYALIKFLSMVKKFELRDFLSLEFFQMFCVERIFQFFFSSSSRI